MRTGQAIVAAGLVFGLAGAAGAQSFDFGLYTGQWDNLTFSSSGPVTMLIEDLGAGMVQMTIDVDGNVFGFVDPPPGVVTGTVVADVFTLDPVIGDPTFGDISGSIDAAGVASFEMLNAAGGSFSSVTISGTAIGGVFDLDYQIFTPNNPTAPFAIGEINMTLVPSPSSLALIGLGGLVMLRRR
tara:strand:- start:2209 stop:2760 length:552 start_codon:yes stop_codon:yes gene_type:complete